MIRSETRQDRACRGHGNTGVIIASSYWQACSSDTIVALFFISLSHLLPYPSLSNVTGEDTAKKLLTFIPSSFFAREIAYFLLVRMSVVDTPQYFMKKHPHPPEGSNQRAVITTDPGLSMHIFAMTRCCAAFTLPFFFSLQRVRHLLENPTTCDLEKLSYCPFTFDDMKKRVYMTPNYPTVPLSGQEANPQRHSP